MSTLKTYNIDSGDTTNLVIKTNGLTALTIDGSTQAATVAGDATISGNATFTNGLTANGNTIIGNASADTITLNGTVQPGVLIAAGTASLAPLDFTSGTVLTTATAGSVEYDGKVFYLTPQGTQRGVVPGTQFYRLNGSLAGANATGAQNILGVGVTLSGSTVYAFDGVFTLAKSAGTTSHTISLLFGGTATTNNIAYQLLGGLNNTSAAPAAGSNNALAQYNQVATAVVISAAITSAVYHATIRVAGTVSVNAGGTFIPQYSLSAAPGGAYTTQLGSYFQIYPIGASGANTSVGAWA